MEKLILRGLCKRLRFDHIDKWYLKKSIHILKNETQIFLHFEIQTNHPVLINENSIYDLMEFAITADYRMKGKGNDR